MSDYVENLRSRNRYSLTAAGKGCGSWRSGRRSGGWDQNGDGQLTRLYLLNQLDLRATVAAVLLIRKLKEDVRHDISKHNETCLTRLQSHGGISFTSTMYSRHYLIKQIMIQTSICPYMSSQPIRQGQTSSHNSLAHPGLEGKSFSSFGISTIGKAARLSTPPPGLAVGTGFLLMIYPPTDFLGEANAKKDSGRVFVGLSSTSSRPSPFSFSCEEILLL